LRDARKAAISSFPMVNYVDSVPAPHRGDGQVNLRGPDDFSGMQGVGRLATECLDALDEIVPSPRGLSPPRQA
jgi:hypothetical protein